MVTAPPGERMRGVPLHTVDGQVVFSMVHPSRIFSFNLIVTVCRSALDSDERGDLEVLLRFCVDSLLEVKFMFDSSANSTLRIGEDCTGVVRWEFNNSVSCPAVTSFFEGLMDALACKSQLGHLISVLSFATKSDWQI